MKVEHSVLIDRPVGDVFKYVTTYERHPGWRIETEERKRPPVTFQPRPSPSTTPAPTFTVSPSPTSTVTPTPSPLPVPTRSPTPAPRPTATVTEGDLVVIRFPDRKGKPAYIAHWTVEVEPGELAAVEYPLVAGDSLEISLFMGTELEGATLDYAYIEAPGGERIVEHRDFSRSWNGEALAPTGGAYRIYFDNVDGVATKTMHLLITYHTPAPGSRTPD